MAQLCVTFQCLVTIPELPVYDRSLKFPVEVFSNKEFGYFKSRVCMAIIVVMAFLAASACRSQGLFIHDIYRIQKFLGGDYAAHFVIGATFTGAAFLIVLPQTPNHVFGVVGLVLLLLGLEEFSQVWIPVREFSWVDMGMGFVGALHVMLVLVSWHFVSSLCRAGTIRAELNEK